MRLGVLDAGSTTVHLLVVDAPRGGHPTPGLRQLINFTSRMAASDRAELEGVSEAEGRVLVGGAGESASPKMSVGNAGR